MKTVFYGNAEIGNDLPSLGFPDYADGIPQRAHDPGRARALLEEAGADGVKVQLTTGPETPGMVEMATLFVEDLKKIGVRASVRELPPGQLYADFPAYSALPLAGSYQMPVPALSTYQMNTAGGSPSAFGWKKSETDALVAQARAERDPERARELGTRAQRTRWDEGNQVVPVFKPNLNAQAKGSTGYPTTSSNSSPASPGRRWREPARLRGPSPRGGRRPARPAVGRGLRGHGGPSRGRRQRGRRRGRLRDATRRGPGRTRAGPARRPAVRRLGGGRGPGDLGRGFVGERPVADVLTTRLPNSLLLAGLTLAVTAPLATLLGLWTGLRGGVADRVVSTSAQILAAVPEFVVAALLVAVLAVWLEVLPRVSVIPLGGTPLDVPDALVLPVLTLSAVGLAVATRLLRASVADTAARPYCEAARLNGVRGVRLAVRHILPNAAGPAVQALTLTTGALVGSAVVVENVFDYPGIGRELQLAVAARDVPMVQGIATALVAVMLAVLLLGDVCARLLGAREGHGR